jgi:hypothetical protein
LTGPASRYGKMNARRKLNKNEVNGKLKTNPQNISEMMKTKTETRTHARAHKHTHTHTHTQHTQVFVRKFKVATMDRLLPETGAVSYPCPLHKSMH